MCTMQAPHNPVPQPNLVPVSLRSSRITHNSGVAAGASVAAGLPFTMKFVAIASSLDPRGAKAFAGLPDHPAGWERLQWPNVKIRSLATTRPAAHFVSQSLEKARQIIAAGNKLGTR